MQRVDFGRGCERGTQVDFRKQTCVFAVADMWQPHHHLHLFFTDQHGQHRRHRWPPARTWLDAEYRYHESPVHLCNRHMLHRKPAIQKIEQTILFIAAPGLSTIATKLSVLTSTKICTRCRFILNPKSCNLLSPKPEP